MNSCSRDCDCKGNQGKDHFNDRIPVKSLMSDTDSIQTNKHCMETQNRSASIFKIQASKNNVKNKSISNIQLSDYLSAENPKISLLAQKSNNSVCVCVWVWGGVTHREVRSYIFLTLFLNTERLL